MVVQLALNIVFCYWLYVSLRNKIQISKLEERIYNMDLHIREAGNFKLMQGAFDSEVVPNSLSSDEEVPQEPVMAASSTRLDQGLASTISERQIEQRPNYLDVYADAAQRLAQRQDLKTISRETGLSLSELRLVEKIASVSSENSAT
ncbi:hypothetical protein GW915_09975 [bacterium]|nr:hypothetical protein [bacterium]